MLSNPRYRTPRKELYANFSLTTHPIRQKVYDICKSLSYVTTNVAEVYTVGTRSYSKFLMEMTDHKMVVCPRGNAPAETYRFWEALYMGKVPIIKKNKGNSFFTELPVVVLENWDQLKDKDFLNSEYEKVKDNPTRMMDMSYWKNIVLNHVSQ